MKDRIARYAKAVVSAIGTAAALGVSLGLQHNRWVSIIIGIAGVLGVGSVPNRKHARQLPE